MEGAVVKNAADKKQVKEASRKVKDLDAARIEDLRAVLQTIEGRRFLWRTLEHCQVFGTIWHGSALIHYNSGRQDVGHYLMDQITQADPEAMVQMIKENKKGEVNV